ncbi:hypothetical protein B0H19DRAFT_1317392 [Mycena capillaripes]|nr:hypothetical protein B0H19DRAFT_1317392 [Mycena capillaripes]
MHMRTTINWTGLPVDGVPHGRPTLTPVSSISHTLLVSHKRRSILGLGFDLPGALRINDGVQTAKGAVPPSANPSSPTFTRRIPPAQTTSESRSRTPGTRRHRRRVVADFRNAPKIEQVPPESDVDCCAGRVLCCLLAITVLMNTSSHFRVRGSQLPSSPEPPGPVGFLIGIVLAILTGIVILCLPLSVAGSPGTYPKVRGLHAAFGYKFPLILGDAVPDALTPDLLRPVLASTNLRYMTVLSPGHDGFSLLRVNGGNSMRVCYWVKPVKRLEPGLSRSNGLSKPNRANKTCLRFAPAEVQIVACLKATNHHLKIPQAKRFEYTTDPWSVNALFQGNIIHSLGVPTYKAWCNKSSLTVMSKQYFSSAEIWLLYGGRQRSVSIDLKYQKTPADGFNPYRKHIGLPWENEQLDGSLVWGPMRRQHGGR